MNTATPKLTNLSPSKKCPVLYCPVNSQGLGPEGLRNIKLQSANPREFMSIVLLRLSANKAPEQDTGARAPQKKYASRARIPVFSRFSVFVCLCACVFEVAREAPREFTRIRPLRPSKYKASERL